MQRYWHILKWPNKFAIILLVAPEEYDSSIAEPKSAVLPITLWSIENQWLNDIVTTVGVEPTRPFLTKGFSCHTCFYTSQLDFNFYSSRCGLAHFSTILEMLHNSNRIVISCIECLNVMLYDYFQRRCLLYVLYAIYEW